MFKVKATSGGGVDMPPPGNHPAVLVGLVDLGTHQETFKQKNGPDRTANLRKVYLVWELVTEKVSGKIGVNHVIAHAYFLAFGPTTALRKMVEGWRGKAFADDEEFDLVRLLDQKCLVNVTHGTSKTSGKVYAKVDKVSAVPKGMTVPEPQKVSFTWSVGNDHLEDLPDWLPYIYGEPVSQVIGRCQEIGNGKQPGPATGPKESPLNPDDSPF